MKLRLIKNGYDQYRIEIKSFYTFYLWKEHLAYGSCFDIMKEIFYDEINRIKNIPKRKIKEVIEEVEI